MAEPVASVSDPVVFILDCDNTLLDNDALKADLDTQLHALLGEKLTGHFWQVYENVRDLAGTVDYPLTFERFRPYVANEHVLEKVRSIVMEYPFATKLYPDTLTTLGYLRTQGMAAIVSDGDSVYQPLKIEASGLAAAVDWRVLVYVHKEDHLEDIFTRWPASFYVMVDDKQRILSATKAGFPQRFVTVHVRQGHYANDDERLAPPADLSIASIGDLRNYRSEDFARYLAK